MSGLLADPIQTNIIRIVLTVRRITTEILGVKGSQDSCRFLQFEVVTFEFLVKVGHVIQFCCFNSQGLISKSPHCLSYNSENVSCDDFVLYQLIIP